MSGYCEDCGCRTFDGVCSNCQEELFIVEHQAADIDGPLSPSFLAAVDEQRELLRQRKERSTP